MTATPFLNQIRCLEPEMKSAWKLDNAQLGMNGFSYLDLFAGSRSVLRVTRTLDIHYLGVSSVISQSDADHRSLRCCKVWLAEEKYMRCRSWRVVDIAKIVKEDADFVPKGCTFAKRWKGCLCKIRGVNGVICRRLVLALGRL